MIRAQVLDHLPVARVGQREGKKGDVRREVTARGAMENGKSVRITEGKEVRKEDPSEYFPRELEVLFES